MAASGQETAAEAKAIQPEGVAAQVCASSEAVHCTPYQTLLLFCSSLAVFPRFLRVFSTTYLITSENWCTTKRFPDGPMLTEEKLCYFMKDEVIGRESMSPGYLARRAKKLEEWRKEGAEKKAQKTTHTETTRPQAPKRPKATAVAEEDDLLPAERVRDPDDPEIEEYESDPVLDGDKEERDLFIEKVGYSVVEQVAAGLMELWREQNHDRVNPVPAVRGKELRDLLSVSKATDWDRRRKEYVDRGLFTLVDGYTRDQMEEAIKWCWTGCIGARAKNGMELYLRTAANCVVGVLRVFFWLIFASAIPFAWCFALLEAPADLS